MFGGNCFWKEGVGFCWGGGCFGDRDLSVFLYKSLLVCLSSLDLI